MAVPTLPDRRRTSKSKVALELSSAAIPTGLLVFVLQGQGSLESLIESQGKMIATLQTTILATQDHATERDANLTAWQSQINTRISSIELMSQSAMKEHNAIDTELLNLDRRLKPIERGNHVKPEP